MGIHTQSKSRSDMERLTMKTNVGVEFLIHRRRPMIVVIFPAIYNLYYIQSSEIKENIDEK